MRFPILSLIALGCTQPQAVSGEAALGAMVAPSHAIGADLSYANFDPSCESLSYDRRVPGTDPATLCDLGCPVIVEGDLTAGATLHDLSCVVAIEGDLDVSTHSAGFSTLTNLERIDGELNASMVDAFGDFTGLEKVRSMGSFRLSLTSQDSLVGLDSLRTIHDNVYIAAPLVDFRGFDALRTVGGDLYVAQVQGFQGLEALETVGGDFDVSDVSATSLEGLSGLRSVGGTIDICCNDGLETLEGLSMSRHNGRFRVRHNDYLMELGPLALQAVLNLEIEDNDQLVDLRGLERLSRVDRITLGGNDSVQTLDGLNGLRHAGVIQVDYSPDLHDVSALHGLLEVDAIYSWPNLLDGEDYGELSQALGKSVTIDL